MKSSLCFRIVCLAVAVQLNFILQFRGILARDCRGVRHLPLPPLVNTTLKVNSFFKREPPFDVQRFLTIPQGFAIELYARVRSARFMLLLPNGDVLVSQMRLFEPLPSAVALLRRSPDGRVSVFNFISGLRLPHDLALVKIAQKYFVYITETHRVARYPYVPGDTHAGKPVQVVIDNLKDDQATGRWWSYLHPLKNIAIKGNELYVALASQTNDDPDVDLGADPKQAAIYRYTLEGRKRMLVAQGLRNVEGLDFDPTTGELWAIVNGRDYIKYPHRDGTGRYGETFDEYMDENPPEVFVHVVPGAHFGWPYCNPVSTESMDDLSYVADVDRNPDESVVNCSTMRRSDKGMAPHSSPLGLSFWTGKNAPSVFKDGALVGLHGSSTLGRKKNINGNVVVFFRFHEGRPGPQYTLIQGWEVGRTYASRWGRPVAALPLDDGSLLISDDFSGSIYRLYKENNTGVHTCE